MMKKFIMAPGPTAIPAQLLAEASMPIPHHRTPGFPGPVQGRQREGLPRCFGTKNPVITFASVGTGAMEGAVRQHDFAR